MDNCGSGSFESQVGAAGAKAGVVGEAICVAGEMNLIVRLVEIACAQQEFGFIVAFESSAWGYVEDAVGSVSVVGGIATALHFDGVDVLGVNLRAEVAGDIGVGDGDAVDEPTDLMAAADVELIVSDVGAGDVVGDHGLAVGARGAGGFLNFEAVYQR